MRKLIAVLLFTAMPWMPAMSHAASCDPVTADEVLAAEDARYAAQVGEDFIAMEQLLADDLVYYHSSTLVDSKASYIDSLRSRTVSYLAMKRSDVTVRTFGCVAVITGLGHFDVRLNGKS